ncbi:MAG: serine/threonine protein kinase [Rhodospirillales bacterium CG15_BIG_FIL_POST_REV_8_21_14_020_66_15]|nr:MAG: serine/threonine protein kinase [Rhodospirillales bacterium CG15_BIG_FIL_POST_REV_8_21_14_020_66_15]
MRTVHEQIHATCVAIGGAGVLLRGPSGAGKSDLALRLIDGGGPHGPRLVADDRVDLCLRDGRVWAQAPEALRGLLEVRGVGIMPMRHVDEAPVALVCDLVAPHQVERLPEERSTPILGRDLPFIRLAPFEASAPAKIRLALRRLPWEERRAEVIELPGRTGERTP